LKGRKVGLRPLRLRRHLLLHLKQPRLTMMPSLGRRSSVLTSRRSLIVSSLLRRRSTRSWCRRLLTRRMLFARRLNLQANRAKSWILVLSRFKTKCGQRKSRLSVPLRSSARIVAILGRDTQLVEVLDDEGQPTGRLAPKVKYRTKNKEGQTVTLDLSPSEAIKRMKDEDEYLNLFRGEGSGGAGLRSQPGGKKPDIKNLATDPAAYRRARKSGEVKFQ
jgi:hypothetical protein